MLEWVKDIVLPVRTEDQLFGSLLFSRAARSWEGRALFRPVNTEIEVLVLGSPAGPSELQRAFFTELERRYEGLRPVVEQHLKSEATRVPSAPGAAFRLVAVDVPEQPGDLAEWALSYETLPPSWHFTVLMRGWSPSQVVAEC
jgi:hypothetical protein